MVDSGASDYMTGLSQLFSRYIPCSSHSKIRTTDGPLAPIAGKYFVVLSDTITLHSISHVPQLFYSLPSIRKLIRDLNCIAKFYPFHCEFKMLLWRI